MGFIRHDPIVWTQKEKLEGTRGDTRHSKAPCYCPLDARNRCIAGKRFAATNKEYKKNSTGAFKLGSQVLAVSESCT